MKKRVRGVAVFFVLMLFSSFSFGGQSTVIGACDKRAYRFAPCQEDPGDVEAYLRHIVSQRAYEVGDGVVRQWPRGLRELVHLAPLEDGVRPKRLRAGRYYFWILRLEDSLENCRWQRAAGSVHYLKLLNARRARYEKHLVH